MNTFEERSDMPGQPDRDAIWARWQAMCRIWEEVLAEDHSRAEDEPPDEKTMLHARQLCHFAAQHRAVLQSHGFNVSVFLGEFGAALSQLERALAEEEHATEILLQRSADLAEEQVHFAEAVYRLKHYYDTLPDSVWASMTETQRADTRELQEKIDELFEGSIGDIPMEIREAMESGLYPVE